MQTSEENALERKHKTWVYAVSSTWLEINDPQLPADNLSMTEIKIKR